MSPAELNIYAAASEAGDPKHAPVTQVGATLRVGSDALSVARKGAKTEIMVDGNWEGSRPSCSFVRNLAYTSPPLSRLHLQKIAYPHLSS